MCIRFVHMRGTTGQDVDARRDFVYNAKCAQCRFVFEDDTHHVAAHVLAYPCANCCCAFVTLQTTCKRCNSGTTQKRVDPHKRSFLRWTRNVKPLRWKCFPSWRTYDASISAA
jgi:hypothetical protein